jgi:hypothetical protein
MKLVGIMKMDALWNWGHHETGVPWNLGTPWNWGHRETGSNKQLGTSWNWGTPWNQGHCETRDTMKLGTPSNWVHHEAWFTLNLGTTWTSGHHENGGHNKSLVMKMADKNWNKDLTITKWKCQWLPSNRFLGIVFNDTVVCCGCTAWR